MTPMNYQSIDKNEKKMINFCLKMVQYTVEQRAFIVETYINLKSYVGVQNSFRERFPDREPPSNRTIRTNVLKYRNTVWNEFEPK